MINFYLKVDKRGGHGRSRRGGRHSTLKSRHKRGNGREESDFNRSTLRMGEG